MFVIQTNIHVATTMTPPPIPYGSASNLPLGNLDSKSNCIPWFIVIT